MQDKETKLPNTAKGLRQLYDVSHTTWAVWLNPIRDQIPLYTKVYTPKQMEAIVKLLGTP